MVNVTIYSIHGSYGPRIWVPCTSIFLKTRVRPEGWSGTVGVFSPLLHTERRTSKLVPVGDSPPHKEPQPHTHSLWKCCFARQKLQKVSTCFCTSSFMFIIFRIIHRLFDFFSKVSINWAGFFTVSLALDGGNLWPFLASAANLALPFRNSLNFGLPWSTAADGNLAVGKVTDYPPVN